MWLILVGLTLLAGDALSQANKIINSETDLLALESDQLIHSSAELLALEDQNTRLPFGARLPGYEQPLFAYSYTVKDGENTHNTKNHVRDVKLNSLQNIPIDQSSQSSENVIYLHDLNIFKPNNSKDLSNKNIKDDQNTETGLAHTKKNIPRNSEIHSVFIKSETKNEKDKSDIDRNDSILGTQHLLSSYLPPPDTKYEPKVPSLDYLPPNEEIPSPTNTNTNKFLDKKYLPPTNEKSLIPKLTLDYLPPEPLKPLAPKLDQSYLPPEEQKIVPVVSKNFKNPESFLSLESDSSEETLLDSLNANYLPPEKSTTKLNLDLSYLPPDKSSKFSVSGIKDQPVDPSEELPSITLNESYLPPQKNLHNIPSLDAGYLPPEKNEKSAVSNVFSAVKPDVEYLLPHEGKLDEKFALNRENLSPIIPIGILRTLQPPSIPFSTNTFTKPILTVKTDKIPPGIASVSVLLPPKPDFDKKKPIFNNEIVKDITSEGAIGLQHKASIQNSPIGIERKESKPIIDSVIGNVKDQPIHVVAEQNKILPPDVDFQSRNKYNQKVPAYSTSVEIKPHEYIKSSTTYKQKIFETSQKVENSFPIGIRRKENKINPDIITEEIKDEPIRPTSEVREHPPYAVFFEHKDEPVQVLKDYEKTIPTVLSSEIRNNDLIEGKKQFQKPEASYSEVINEPILPVATYNKFPFANTKGQESYHQTPFKVTSLVASDFKSNIDQPIHPKKKITPVTIGVESSSNLEYREKINKNPLADYKKRIPDTKIIPQSHYGNYQIPVVSESKEERLRPTSSVKTTQNYIVQSKSPYECLSNAECEEKDVCQNGRCILGCSLANDLCIGEANCETRHHVPACVCPLMSTARTVYKSGYVQFDCVAMVMPASSKIITEYSQKRLPSRVNTISYQRPIVAPVRSTASFVQSPISHSTAFRGTSGSPCSPSPCGPNTRCDVNRNGIAQCRCIDDYVPDGHTINGCKPQCSHDGECPDDYQCQNLKCVRVCTPGACGLYADCRAVGHSPECTCPPGYGGDAKSRCTRNLPEVRAPPDLPVDPCVPNPCGTNADCKERGERAVCYCPVGYEGNPLTNCIKGECIGHDDCPNHLACQALRCIDPCAGVCGSGAECTVRNHQPVCSCPRNHIGDPFSNCRKITEYDVCNPTPCGQNTNCKAKYERDGGLRAVCSCIDNYIGSPLTGCRPECVRDTDCSANQHCKENRCRNPCVNGCGEGAYCDVRNHRAECTCPEHFLGDPHSRCYTECTAHEDCPDFEACNLFKCINPCEGACGTGADCKVEDHTPICSCPRGYTGDPFVSCRAFTLDDLCRDNPCGSNAECHPGKDRSGNDRPVCTCPRGYIGNPLISCRRGECESHDSCPDHQACYGYLCQSPCVTETGSVCGLNADCKVKNHTPVCSCPRGYTGNPLDDCRISASARIAGRSHRKQ